jgi:hypothetical protein
MSTPRDDDPPPPPPLLLPRVRQSVWVVSLVHTSTWIWFITSNNYDRSAGVGVTLGCFLLCALAHTRARLRLENLIRGEEVVEIKNNNENLFLFLAVLVGLSSCVCVTVTMRNTVSLLLVVIFATLHVHDLKVAPFSSSTWIKRVRLALLMCYASLLGTFFCELLLEPQPHFSSSIVAAFGFGSALFIGGVALYALQLWQKAPVRAFLNPHFNEISDITHIIEQYLETTNSSEKFD